MITALFIGWHYWRIFPFIYIYKVYMFDPLLPTLYLPQHMGHGFLAGKSNRLRLLQWKHRVSPLDVENRSSHLMFAQFYTSSWPAARETSAIISLQLLIGDVISPRKSIVLERSALAADRRRYLRHFAPMSSLRKWNLPTPMRSAEDMAGST